MVRPTIGISLVRRQKRRDHHTRRFLETDTSILNIGNGLSNPPYLRRLVVVDVDSVGRPATQMPEPEDSMRYMCLIYDNEQTWAKMSKPEADAVMGEYFAFTKDIRSSGHYQAGEALQAVSTATTVRVRDGKLSTTDGPFAETKEYLGGFYLINARDLNEAI